MKTAHLNFILVILLTIPVIAQKEGDIIFNEIGNGGTKKAMYYGGDYVELLVLKEEGIKLAGFYLTDLSSTSGKPKESEGYVKFSEKEGSIFNTALPRGTYILICIGDSRQKYGAGELKEKISIDDKKIILFTEDSPDHLEQVEGTISLTGKDNIALLSAWDKKAAVDIVTWEGSTSWVGCEVTQLPIDLLENGEIVYFNPTREDFSNNTKVESWISTSDEKAATPGRVNKDVDDFPLKK